MKKAPSFKAFFRKPTALFCSAGLLASAFCGHGAWTAWSEASALDEDNAALTARVAKADRDLAVTTAIEDEVLIQRHKLEAYAKLLPDDAEINDFVEQLTRSAAEARVQITELDDSLARSRRARKGTQREPFARVTYRLKLAADMEGLLRFLDSFENRYQRFVAFPTLSLESGSSENAKESKAHTVDLVLETYVYEPKTQQDGAVAIPEAAARMEQLIAAKRIEAATDVGLERYAFLGAGGRRDPFRDPGERIATVAATASAPVAEVSAVPAVVPEASAIGAEAARVTVVQDALSEGAERLKAGDLSAAEAALTKARDGLRVLAQGAAAEALSTSVDQATAVLALHTEVSRKQLEITGAIVCAEDATRSLAVVNGRGFVAGESIEECRLIAVHADGVDFEFKGLSFRRQLAVRASAPVNGKSK